MVIEIVHTANAAGCLPIWYCKSCKQNIKIASNVLGLELSVRIAKQNIKIVNGVLGT